MSAPAETTTLPVPLSVLDVVPVTSAETAVDALARAGRLARHVDELGFRRIWYAEHHNMPGIGSTTPEVLTANTAAITSRIRVGSGGVMLPNHSPLTVAERYATLEALHPGRIDLGIGRAPGTDMRTARALRRSLDTGEDLDAQLAELMGYLAGFPAGHPLERLRAYPRPGSLPQIVVLGSSDYGARLAAALGLPYAFAHHFSSQFSVPAMRLYRDGYRPSAAHPTPHAILTVTVVCAGNDEEALELASAWALSFVRLRTGQPPSPFPTREEVAAHEWTAGERELADGILRAQAVGSPDTVRDKLLRLIEATDADEVMVTTPVTDEEARHASFRMVAELAERQRQPSG
jgi:luciferase family oxidoreductase group 1